MKSLVICANFLVFVVGVSGVTNDTPLCTPCTCQKQNNNMYVDCTKAGFSIVQELYKADNFIDAANNSTLYDIYSLNLSSITFVHLKQVLPKSSLRVLDLTNADITEMEPAAFQNLQQMVELKLGFNRIEQLTPDTFKGIQKEGADYPLQNLKILRLNNNNLRHINNDAFQHIEQTLEELYLQGNQMGNLDLETTQAITGIVHLTTLDLSNNELARLPEGFLHTPAFLEVLYLDNNQITDVRNLGLELGLKLRKLVLDGNPIVNITEQTAFPTVPSLKVLHMCNMPDLELVGDHSMCSLSGLEELHMSENPKLHKLGEDMLIRVEQGSEVPVVQNIRKLCLSNNQLTRLEVILNWDILTDFDINGNPWTCEFENQWMVDTLIPIYCRINEEKCKALRCAAPEEMEERTFYELHEKKYVMRRLDYYGNHPENDGIILVCFMLGLLIGIVAILFIAYAWKRHWFGLFDPSPAAYSRQFYGRTASIPNDEFMS